MDQPALRLLTPLLLAAAVSVAVAGPTYRWVDPQGVVHYSDTPQPGAQQIALPGRQTYHSTPAATAAPASTPSTPSSEAAGYQSCVIVQPGPQQTLFSPESVHVTVALTPSLRPGDSLSVTLDGAALPPIIDGGQEYQITDIDRGQHSLNAVVRNSAGRSLCTATAVTFNVQRPSVANPVAPARPH